MMTRDGCGWRYKEDGCGREMTVGCGYTMLMVTRIPNRLLDSVERMVRVMGVGMKDGSDR